MIWLAIFGVSTLVAVYYIFALLYHWLKYSSTFPLSLLAIPVYLIGVGVLTLIALIALVAIPS